MARKDRFLIPAQCCMLRHLLTRQPSLKRVLCRVNIRPGDLPESLHGLDPLNEFQPASTFIIYQSQDVLALWDHLGVPLRNWVDVEEC